MTFHLFFSKEPFQMILELIRFDSHLFSTCLKHSFYSFPCGFYSCLIRSPFKCIALSSNFKIIPTSSIVFRASVATAFSTFNISLVQEAWICLFSDFHMEHPTSSLASLYTSCIGFNPLLLSSPFRKSLSSLACFLGICFNLRSL